MPLVRCPGCKESLEVSDDRQNARVRCPYCREVFEKSEADDGHNDRRDDYDDDDRARRPLTRSSRRDDYDDDDYDSRSSRRRRDGYDDGYGPASQDEIKQFAGKKIAAGICGILLGGLGVHKFVLGFPTAGVIMLLVTIIGSCVSVGPLIMGVIGLVEGIMYLTKSDEEFYQLYAIEKREWF